MRESNDVKGAVAVYSLGGTIAMTGGESGGVTPTLGAADLALAVPGLADSGIDVVLHDFRQVPSASLRADDIVELAAAIRADLDDGAVGAVITQGTDTIEETSFLLDLLHDGPEPIVVTGAMRHPSLASADGAANILAAVQVAANSAMRDLGCVVVFNDEIHAARFVHKSHTTSTATFVSPNTGPLGYVAEGTPTLFTRPAHRTITVSDGVSSAVSIGAPHRARVALVTVGFDDDGELLRTIDDRFDGLILAGVGAGHVSTVMVPLVSEVAARIPVVLASRTSGGRVLSQTYGYIGSEKDLLERGLISARYLNPLKARVLLRMLLRSAAGRDEIVAAFEAH